MVVYACKVKPSVSLCFSFLLPELTREISSLNSLGAPTCFLSATATTRTQQQQAARAFNKECKTCSPSPKSRKPERPSPRPRTPLSVVSAVPNPEPSPGL